MSTTNKIKSALRIKSNSSSSICALLNAGVSINWIWISSTGIIPGMGAHVVNGDSKTFGVACVTAETAATRGLPRGFPQDRVVILLIPGHERHPGGQRVDVAVLSRDNRRRSWSDSPGA